MKATVLDGCISCGVCEEVCPEVFKIGDSGVAEVIGDVTDQNADKAKEAAEGCPVSVITVE